jgi:hypothetical protein
MIGIRIRVLQFNGDEVGAPESFAQSAIGFKCSGRRAGLTRLRSFHEMAAYRETRFASKNPASGTEL